VARSPLPQRCELRQGRHRGAGFPAGQHEAERRPDVPDLQRLADVRVHRGHRPGAGPRQAPQ
jgi:hypothetical protein